MNLTKIWTQKIVTNYYEEISTTSAFDVAETKSFYATNAWQTRETNETISNQHGDKLSTAKNLYVGYVDQKRREGEKKNVFWCKSG